MWLLFGFYWRKLNKILTNKIFVEAIYDTTRGLRSENILKEGIDVTLTDVKLHKLVNSILRVSLGSSKVW